MSVTEDALTRAKDTEEELLAHEGETSWAEEEARVYEPIQVHGRLVNLQEAKVNHIFKRCNSGRVCCTNGLMELVTYLWSFRSSESGLSADKIMDMASLENVMRLSTYLKYVTLSLKPCRLKLSLM